MNNQLKRHGLSIIYALILTVCAMDMGNCLFSLTNRAAQPSDTLMCINVMASLWVVAYVFIAATLRWAPALYIDRNTASWMFIVSYWGALIIIWCQYVAGAYFFGMITVYYRPQGVIMFAFGAVMSIWQLVAFKREDRMTARFDESNPSA